MGTDITEMHGEIILYECHNRQDNLKETITGTKLQISNDGNILYVGYYIINSSGSKKSYESHRVTYKIPVNELIKFIVKNGVQGSEQHKTK